MTTDRTGRLLREVARLLTREQFRAVESNNITNSRWNLLAELKCCGSLAMTELGRRVGREKSWVSRSVDVLAARGLVVKVPNPIDSRQWLVTLTDEGFRLVCGRNAALNAHATQMLCCLSEGDRAAVEKSLLLLVRVLTEDRSTSD
ncbi:MAG: MarR family transcriptional regulator [Alcaligenaceae bacterium]|nr:MAG: MarR family transcriptional regulator [Alcaligenaceae bacterium]